MPEIDAATTLCTYCPNLCRDACPVSNAEPRETLIPRAKMAALGRQHRGEQLLSLPSTAALWACTGCGACAESCKHQVEPAQHLFAGRAEAAREDLLPPPLASLPPRVRAHAESAARAVRRAVPSSRFPSEAQVALLPACDAPEEVAPALALCDRLGARYLAVADVGLACGGYPLLAAGQLDAFRAHARELAAQLAGYARLVVACPACAHTMKREYPAHGIGLRAEVLHVAEFLGPFAAALPIARRLGPAWYHDPCYLGRRSGVYEAPRRLLSRALTELRELPDSRERAACSGGGGLLPLTMPAVAEAIADARLDEVVASEVRTVVTACPTCVRRLSRRGVFARGLIETLEEATRPEPVP